MSSKGKSSNGSSLAQSNDVHTPSGHINNPSKVIIELWQDPKWRAILAKNLNLAQKIELERRGVKKYEDTEAAVCALVFKIGRLTNHDMPIIKEVLRRSKYEEDIDYDASKLSDHRKRAIEQIGFEL